MNAVIKQLVRFGVVGLVGTASHYVVLVALVKGASANAVFASTIGAVVGALVNYVLNHVAETFDSDRPHREALPRFMLVAAFGFAINAAVMVVLTNLRIYYLASQVVASAIVFLFNFVANRSWTFRRAEC